MPHIRILSRLSFGQGLYFEVLQSQSDDVESQLGVVNSYVVERNFVQARATMNEILTAYDSDVSAWLTSASLSMRTRDAARAASDYERALALLTGQGEPHREMRALTGYAEAVLLENRPDDARGALTRMQQIAPQDIRTMLIAARLSALAGDWTTAQVQLQEILRLAPDYRPAQMLLGVVHKESGNLGQAEMYLSAVVADAPDNRSARQLLAQTRLELNKSAAARQAIDAVVAGPNADARSLSIAAAASLGLGEFDDAADLLQRGLAADPGNLDLRIELALAYFRSGKIEQAQSLLQDLPADASERNEFRRDMLLVMLQLTSGPADAIAAADALLQRWPEQVSAYNLAGSISMANGDYETAREKFLASRDLVPGDFRSLRYLAQLDEIEDDLEAAERRYLEILDLNAADAPAMVALSRLALLGEDDVESLEWLEKARAADALAVTPRAMLGARYLTRRDFDAAAAVAEEGIDIDPGNANLHNILGFARFGNDDLRGALSEFRRAIAIDPDEPAYTLNLARAQDRQGNPDTAMATLTASMERTLAHIPSGVLLAWLHIRADELDAAGRVAEELRDLHSDNASPYALLGEVLLRRGDFVGASAAYDQASSIQVEPRFAVRAYQIRRGANLSQPLKPIVDYLEERPFDSTTRLLFAQALQRDGLSDEAYAQYARILEHAPDNLVAGNNLAWGYFKNGDPRAETVARSIYDKHPDNSAIVDTLGWILVNKGELASGVALLRDAVRLNDGSSEIRYHLAAGLVQAGEPQEAKRLLQEILSSTAKFASRDDAERLLETL